MKRKIRRLLLLPLLAFSLIFSGCSSIKIPKSIGKAKKKIERNYEEINAISDYYGLSNPTKRIDTVTIEIPERKLNIDIPKVDNRKVDSLLREYGSLVTVDSSNQQSVDIITKQILVESRTIKDTVYEDSTIVISIKNLGDSLSIDYTLKSQKFSETIETDVIEIDTQVAWYEDNYLRIVVLVLFLTILFLVVYNKTRRN